LGTVISLPDTLTVTKTADIPDSNNPLNLTSAYVFKVSGLNPAYTYNWQVQENTTFSPLNPVSWVDVSGSIGPLSTALDESFNGEGYIILSSFPKGAATTSYRIVVTIGVVNRPGTGNPPPYWLLDQTRDIQATDSYLNRPNRKLLTTF
jgi:hypothetical protein